jgi:hypothetical protein
MIDICIGDLVVNSDPSVIGEVLADSGAAGGQHSAEDLDLWGTGQGPRYATTGLIPVRWNTDDGSYEWWEAPAFLTVVRPALATRETGRGARRESPCAPAQQHRRVTIWPKQSPMPSRSRSPRAS